MTRTGIGISLCLLSYMFCSKILAAAKPSMACFTPRLGLNNSRIFEIDGFEVHIPPHVQLKNGIAQARIKGGVGSAASSSSSDNGNSKKMKGMDTGKFSRNGAVGSGEWTGQEYKIEIPMTYFGSLWLGFTAAFIVPLVMNALGLA